MVKSQQGFTLIELMVALLLGLLISAAALQLLYTNSLSSNIQKAGSNIVDSNTFGLDYLTKRIRKANYGVLSAQSFFLNHRTPQGGIVLTAPDDLKVFGNTYPEGIVPSNLRGLSKSNQKIPTDLLTRSESSLSGSNVVTGTSALASDQLTIQYKAIDENQMDCQGRNVMKDDYVIERYFVRDGGLACASAIYTYDESVAKKEASNQNAIDIDKYKKPIKQSDGTNVRDTAETTQNLAGNGEIIIPNVDYFRVLLGVSDSKDFSTEPNNYKLSYMTIPTPATSGDPFPSLTNKRIVNLQIALLIRSDSPVTAAKDPQYDILDKTGIKLNDTSKNDGKMRRVLQTTVLLRNARGTIK